MDITLLVDLATLFLAIVLKLVVAGVMLVKTVRWTWLGRGFLMLFATLAVAFINSLVWKIVGVNQPDVIYFGLRAIFILDCILILEGLRRHDWTGHANGIQWAQLLGFDNRIGERP